MAFIARLLMVAAPLSVQSSEPLPAQFAALRLGEVSLNISTNNSDAADWFTYGLLHLLSFGYDYATPAFRQSRDNDPRFAMAYAFEAFANFWPLWGTEFFNESVAILDNMTNATDLELASPHERLYIDAALAHFNQSRGERDKAGRISDAVAAFERVAAAFPSDPTAHAFAGLWRLELASTQADAALSAETNSLAERSFEAALAIDPRHPGAVHYVLHLYDVLNVTVAKKGLPAAKLYPDVAPDTSHGQHMPGHIFLRLANYSAVYAADSLALEAADTTCTLYGMADDEGCDIWNLYHSLEYLQYSGYQCGRWEDAHTHWLRMNDTFATAAAKQHAHLDNLALWFLRMEAREILERGIFLLLAGQPFPNMSCGLPMLLEPGFWTSHTESGALLAHGLCRVFRDRPSNDTASPGRQELNALRERLGEIPNEFGSDDEGNPSPYYNHQVNAMHVKMLDATDLFVQSQEADNEGDKKSLLQRAWSTADEATSLEEQLSAQPDSPTILFLSAHELLGNLRVQAGSPADAREAFGAFGEAARLQAKQLSTELGRARAKEIEGCPGEAAAWYRSAAALMDPESDREALPFWSSMQRGMTLEGDCRLQGSATTTESTDSTITSSARIFAAPVPGIVILAAGALAHAF